MAVFDKCAVFTDIHFGKKNNSKIHNEDCLSFVKWVVSECKKENIKTLIFMGDWHDNRRTLNILTMDYSIRAFELLNDNFDKVYFIIGNHDIFFREKRDVHSIQIAEKYKNIKVIDEIYKEDELIFVPWLVQDEYKLLKNVKAKYMFGHFEIPTFLNNSKHEITEYGTVELDSFKNINKVFSGHFHARQVKNNVHYIGNCFPHDFSDANDLKRGFMILTWDGDITYKTWEDQPRYTVIELSKLLDDPSKYINDKTYIRIIMDIDLSYEDTMQLKDELMKNHSPRDISLVQKDSENSVDDMTLLDTTVFKTVDQLILEGLNKLSEIENNNIDANLLKSIYNDLDITLEK